MTMGVRNQYNVPGAIIRAHSSQYLVSAGIGIWQGSHGDWKTWKMKMVMEKSWNLKTWSKVMEFWHYSWNFTNSAHESYVFCHHKKLSIDVESVHFLMFSAKSCECRIDKRDGHGKVMKRYFVKSVGTLIWAWGIHNDLMVTA